MTTAPQAAPPPPPRAGLLISSPLHGCDTDDDAPEQVGESNSAPAFVDEGNALLREGGERRVTAEDAHHEPDAKPGRVWCRSTRVATTIPISRSTP